MGFSSNYKKRIDEEIFRHELKYIIPERLVEPIRQYISTFCQPDPHSLGGSSYTITSLYLDTLLKKFYLDTKKDMPYRKKLRLRTYGNGRNQPLIFEIKKKVKDLVHKSRTTLSDSEIDLLNNPEALLSRPSCNLQLVELLNFNPTVLVRYQREAYESTFDEYARVTIDRNISYQSQANWDLQGDIGDWQLLDMERAKSVPCDWVVLELKASTQSPIWMVQLIQEFNLTRCGFSKYATSYEQSSPYTKTDVFDTILAEVKTNG